MSSALINRSLNTIRTELDFLLENNVINQDTFNQFEAKLPKKWEPNAAPVRATEFMEALYDFKAQEDGDLPLRVGDKVEIIEKLSSDWYKGRCNGKVGTFPANYVKPAFSGSNNDSKSSRGRQESPERSSPSNYSDSHHENSSTSSAVHRPSGPPPPQPPQPQPQPQPSYLDVPQPYSPTPSPQPLYQPQYAQPPVQYQQPPMQPPAPYPPSFTNYYQQPPPPQQVVVQQVPVQQQQSGGSNSVLSGFGSKLGNAAIFGAGSAIGSDIVNSIF